MSYAVADMKWGTPTLGTESGTILWSSDLVTGLNYDTGTYSAGQFDSALQAAFDAWENSAAVDFEYTSSFAAADITFDMASLPGSTVGRAITTFAVLPGTDRIIESEIDMDSDVTWAPYGDASGGLSFFAVALHEIGHAIGLEHVNDTSEIMNPFVEANELGDGDVQGARVLYGADPGDVGGDPNPDDSPTPAQADNNGGSEDSDGGGGVSGLAGLLFAAVLALVGFLFGPGGAAVGMAVGLGRSGRDDNEDDTWAADDEAVPQDETVTTEEAEAIWMAHGDEVDLAELIPMLEDEGIEFETHEHVIGEGGCDGHCGGCCGHPDHVNDALNALV